MIYENFCYIKSLIPNSKNIRSVRYTLFNKCEIEYVKSFSYNVNELYYNEIIPFNDEKTQSFDKEMNTLITRNINEQGNVIDKDIFYKLNEKDIIISEEEKKGFLYFYDEKNIESVISFVTFEDNIYIKNIYFKNVINELIIIESLKRFLGILNYNQIYIILLNPFFFFENFFLNKILLDNTEEILGYIFKTDIKKSNSINFYEINKFLIEKILLSKKESKNIKDEIEKDNNNFLYVKNKILNIKNKEGYYLGYWKNDFKNLLVFSSNKKNFLFNEIKKEIENENVNFFFGHGFEEHFFIKSLINLSFISSAFLDSDLYVTNSHYINIIFFLKNTLNLNIDEIKDYFIRNDIYSFNKLLEMKDEKGFLTRLYKDIFDIKILDSNFFLKN